MKSILIRVTLLSLCLILFISQLSQATTEQRTALVIGNSAYSTGPLKNPVHDATDMATTLQRLGFKVILKKNANLETMEEAVENFGNSLKRGGVGLFYFAGHGVQVNGINYLIPIGANINKESDVKYRSVDANKILDEMANANNGLNIVILDACRDNPYANRFRSATRGLAIVSSAPTGTFVSYSTSPGHVAKDGEGRNSPYTSALIQYMNKPGLSIEDVFKNVRRKLREETGQVPWELSSLEGKFYFIAPSAAARESSEPEETEKPVSSPIKDTMEVAKVAPSPISAVNEIGRDSRFIAYSDGTVLDTKTNLMWAAKDNGFEINWQDAKNYCENYRGGGYKDWRMPTKDEVEGLYDARKAYQSECRGPFGGTYAIFVTELIHLTCDVIWANDTRGTGGTPVNLGNGAKPWIFSHNLRALPVRFVK
jgi:hypothetical protein